MYIVTLQHRRFRGKKRPQIRGPEDAERLYRHYVKDRTREQLVVLLLNVRDEVIGLETVSVGSRNAAILSSREVFKPARLHRASGIILLHNHPSGDPEPSDQDISATKQLVALGKTHRIHVLDHLIIGDRNFVSMRDRKLI